MKKKKIIITSVCLAVFAAALIFLSPFLIPNPMEKTLNVDFAKVDKLSIGDGVTGNDCYLTDKAGIQKFLKRFDGAYLRKSFNQFGTSGIGLSVMLYESGENVCSFNCAGNLITVWKGHNFVRYVSNINIGNSEFNEIEKYYKLENKST